MKKLSFLLFFAAFALIQSLQAQVGINILNPDSSAILHINSNTKGVLLPEVEKNNRTNMSSNGVVVANGLLIYDPVEKLFYFRDKDNLKWIVLNPFRVSDESTSTPWNDIRLSKTYKEKNVYIGSDTTITAQAKLHIGGTVQADGALTAKSGINVTSGTLKVGNNTTISSTSATLGGATTINGNTTVNGNATVTTNLTVSNNTNVTQRVTANNFVGYGTIPLGGIIMWSGTAIPDGWALCDGGTSNGYTTPDLRGRFVVGIGQNQSPAISDSNPDYQLGNTGGENQHRLTLQEMPRHNHDLAIEGRKIAGGQVLTNLPGGGGQGIDYLYRNGGDQAHENRPPYYALAFIMRVK